MGKTHCLLDDGREGEFTVCRDAWQVAVVLAVCTLPQRLWPIVNVTLSDRVILHVVLNFKLPKWIVKNVY